MFQSRTVAMHPLRQLPRACFVPTCAPPRQFAGTQHVRRSARPLRAAQRRARVPLRATASADETDADAGAGGALGRIRVPVASVAALGVVETAFLTFTKLFASPGSICSTQGCFDVLTGPFSAVLGVPLSAFGMLAYGAVAYLALWPMTADEETRVSEDGTVVTLPKEGVYAARDAATRPLLLAVSAAMMVFSSYLMMLLMFVIRSMCPYCVVSAGLSVTLFTLVAFVGRAVPDAKRAVRIGGGGAALAFVAAAGSFFLALPEQLLAQAPSEPQTPPAVTRTSTRESVRLAKKLKGKNTKMYGAYWCTHCYDQKQKFGKKAFSKIDYVECDRYGVKSEYKLCRQKRIPGYPTWEIEGQLYPGEIEIDELEKIVDGKPE